MEILFDLRNQPESRLVEQVNSRLRKERPDYLTQFGEVGSTDWWKRYDAGHICRTIHSGIVTHLGVVEVSEHCEEEDVIRISTDRRNIEYDREGFWLHDSIEVGNRIEITTVKVVTSSCTSILGVRIIRDTKG